MTTNTQAFLLGPFLGSLILASAHAAAQGSPAVAGVPSPGAAGTDGPALSWGDLDGDGRLDALSITTEGRLRLLASRASGFEDVTESAGLAALDTVSLALWGDYDGDGRGDLFVGRGAGASLLLRNEGGSFVDMAASAGLVIEEPVQAAHWLDEDGDGRLDLHVVTGTANRIWRGLEGGFFEPVELPLDATPGTPTFGGSSPSSSEIADPTSGPRTEEKPEGAAERVQRSVPARGPTTGSQPLVAPPPLLGGTTPILPFPSGCATSLRDQSSPGSCMMASSEAELGALYPLSDKFFVDESTGNVGIGTTAPSYRLHVDGQVVSGSSNSASGSNAAVGGGSQNAASGSYATIGGGRYNTVSGGSATVAGGQGNAARHLNDTIAGGAINATSAQSGSNNTIGGGALNTVEGGTALTNTIAGGMYNLVSAPTASGNTISGGTYNEIVDPIVFQYHNTISGGRSNLVAGSRYATIGGGSFNRTAGNSATIPGGQSCEASADYSFAAGRRAKALHAGSFVWGDSQDLYKSSTAADQFNVFAEGGMLVFADGVATPSLAVDAAGNVGVGTTAPAFTLEVNGTAGKPGGGSWSVSSDARLKKDVEDLEGALETLLALRGVTFEYIDPNAIGELEGRRIGFLAQEVERVLPDWVDEKENGTKYLTIRGFEALAVEALRELDEECAAKDARISELEASGRELEARVAQLEQVQLELESLSARLAALER